MARVLALVEGPTERNFSQRVLAPHLGYLGVELHPRVIGKPGHKGGVGPWDRCKREILALVRQEPQSLVTTMFDFYALPRDWPGRQEALDAGLRHLEAVLFVERRIDEALRAELSGSGPEARLLVYLSLHEYEALLFSEPAALAGVTGGSGHAEAFQEVLDECGECEKINDRWETAPSRRISSIAPGYSKAVDGVTAAERIGLTRIREKCPHFATWLSRLEGSG